MARENAPLGGGSGGDTVSESLLSNSALGSASRPTLPALRHSAGSPPSSLSPGSPVHPHAFGGGQSTDSPTSPLHSGFPTRESMLRAGSDDCAESLASVQQQQQQQQQPQGLAAADPAVTLTVRSVTQAGQAQWGASPNPDLPNNVIVTKKYTKWNFFPKNLLVQFHKVSNLYFLVNMCFALIPGVSPVVPITTIAPLVCVVGVAMVRDAWEDYKRSREDDKANGVAVSVLDPATGELNEVRSRDIAAGSIVCLTENQEIPADIVVLSSARDDEGVYVETANLDGETNLKKKAVVSATKNHKTPAGLNDLDISVLCDKPSPKLSSWDGVFNSGKLGVSKSVEMGNLLLRGCVVRQTPYLYGFVVYTGVVTKMSLNLTPPPIKKSRIDRKLSRLIMIILALQQLCITILCAISLYFARASSQSDAFYISYYNHKDSAVLYFVMHYLTYFVLLSLMMPISLFLSIEFCKLLQAQFMEWDLKMYDEERDLAMKAKTASLNEELSQVQTICTDKTGTLTENKMVFSSAYVKSRTFVELSAPGGMLECLRDASFFTPDKLAAHRAAQRSRDPKAVSGVLQLDLFLQSMAVCNTLIPTPLDEARAMQQAQEQQRSPASSEGSLEMSSSLLRASATATGGIEEYSFTGDSTDEVALATVAQTNGYTLTRRTETAIRLNISKEGGGAPRAASAAAAAAENLDMEVLGTLPFSSDRKMMSVVVRHPHYGLILLVKGSDTAILAACAGPDAAEAPQLHRSNERVLHGFACEGLRTLCFAYRLLREDEYAQWKRSVWDPASVVMVDKQHAIDNACRALETQLRLLGSTGIEDKLQEGVPETIGYFKMAGLVLWVLTGDKKETAVNIAKSSNVVHPTLTEIVELDVAGYSKQASGGGSGGGGGGDGSPPCSPTSAEGRRRFEAKAAFMRQELQKAIMRIEAMHGLGDPYGSPPTTRTHASYAAEISDRASFCSYDGSFVNTSAVTTAAAAAAATSPSQQPVTHTATANPFKRKRAPSFHASRNSKGGSSPTLPTAAQTDGEQRAEACILVDGLTLEVVFADDACKETFRELSKMVGCALCCRVTPMQKADVVSILQDQGITCLSIGDGANDVSMIQRAKVGVGIMGLEGSQAERSSDYAVPRFRHLVPLLAVHGRYSLLKNSYLIQYSFYKNLVYSLCQISYSFFTGFTGQTLFDSWVIINYNMIFTLLPPLVMGLFEYDVRCEDIYRYPLLYYDLRGSRGGRLSRISVIRWLVWSVVHSAAIFGLLIPLMQNDDCAIERSSGIWTMGTYVMSVVITVVTAKAGLCFMSWTWMHFASLAVSLLLYHVFVIAYSSIPMFFGRSEYHGVWMVAYSDPKFYLWIVGITTLLVVLEVSVVYWAKEGDPRLVDVVRESLHLRTEGLRAARGRSYLPGTLSHHPHKTAELEQGTLNSNSSPSGSMLFNNTAKHDDGELDESLRHDLQRPLLDRAAPTRLSLVLGATPSPSMLPSRRDGASDGASLQGVLEATLPSQSPHTPLLQRESSAAAALSSSPGGGGPRRKCGSPLSPHALVQAPSAGSHLHDTVQAYSLKSRESPPPLGASLLSGDAGGGGAGRGLGAGAGGEKPNGLLSFSLTAPSRASPTTVAPVGAAATTRLQSGVL